MRAYGKLLVPTDFSQYTPLALDHATLLAEAFSAHLLLLHVIPQETREVLVRTRTEGQVDGGEEIFRAIMEQTQSQINGLLGHMPEDRVTRLIRVGHPVLEIIATAGDQGVDLIVMPTHGRTGLSHVLFGSVAEKVVRRAPCPVMVVRSAVSGPGPSKPL
jgi:universal stress protein A